MNLEKLNKDFKKYKSIQKKIIKDLTMEYMDYKTGGKPAIYDAEKDLFGNEILDEDGTPAWSKFRKSFIIGNIKSQITRKKESLKKVNFVINFIYNNKQYINNQNIIFTNMIINDIVKQNFKKGLPKTTILKVFSKGLNFQKKSTKNTYLKNIAKIEILFKK